GGVGGGGGEGGGGGDGGEGPREGGGGGEGGGRQERGGAGGGEDAANQMDVAGDRARLGDVQAVGAQQKCRGPPDEAPSPQRTDAARHDDVERGSLTPQERQRLRERGLAGADDGVEPSTRGLAEGEKDERAEQHARH